MRLGRGYFELITLPVHNTGFLSARGQEINYAQSAGAAPETPSCPAPSRGRPADFRRRAARGHRPGCAALCRVAPTPGSSPPPRGGSGAPGVTHYPPRRGCRGTRALSGTATPRPAPPAPLARPGPEAAPAPQGRRKERAGRSPGRAGALQGRAPRTRRAPGDQRCGRSRALGDPP